MTPGDTFLDVKGVTHEALELAYRHGAISLCGQLREPVSDIGRETVQLRALEPLAPSENVDCMTCMTRRVRLDLAANEIPGYRRSKFEIIVRVTSWG